MKKLGLIVALLCAITVFETEAQCCKGKTDKKECVDKECSSADVEKAEVVVYYFHATRRCATCEAVESVTKKTINAKYKSKVVFVSVNREKQKEMAKKYKVSGQTLLLTKGKKVVNLTNDAFMYARNSPEKYEKKLEAQLEKLL